MFDSKFRDVKKAIEAIQTSTTPQDGMTLKQVLAGMLQLLGGERVNHHRLGQFYNYTVKNKLAEAEGYKSAQEYFSKNIRDLSASTLAMYGAVADAFSEEVCAQFGVTRLYVLLTYKEAADIQVSHEEPGSTAIDVPDDKGVVTSKSFSDCSVEEIRKAIVAKRTPSSSKPLPAEDVAFAAQLEKAVVARFVKGDPVRVQMRNHKGTPVFDFKGIPKQKLSNLIEALQAQSVK